MARGEQILALTDSAQWREARALYRTRASLSEQHFIRYPIGPEHKAQYQQRLPQLFKLEQLLDAAMNSPIQQPITARPALRLVAG